jgi:hypothetical protein
MKISEMIRNLQDVAYKYGDLECWYAVDDEGNAYRPVYYEPSIYYVNAYGDMFQEEDLDGEDEEDIAELARVCIVN